MNTTYPINYDNSTFFSSSENIAATFPFNLSDVVTWAKTAPNKPLSIEDANKVVDIFDSKLSAVITNPGNKTSFLNFLGEKMYLNSYFEDISVSSDNVSSSTNYINTSVNINGRSYNGTAISRNGSTSYLLGNPGRQRVLYRPVCTKNHLHFSDCTVQQIVKSGTDESYYQCTCTGTPEFNNKPHSHCSQFTNNETDAQSAIDRYYFGIGGSGSQRKESSTKTSGSNTSYNVKYANSEMLKQTDTEIKTAIYLYYVAVNENFIYKAALEKNKKLSNTTNQLLSDSTVKYKNQYLNMFNLLSGIIIAGGYIYMLR